MMCKYIDIISFGSFFALLFTATVMSFERDSDTYSQSKVFAYRNALNLDKSSKRVEDIRRISHYIRELFKKKSSFTDAQLKFQSESLIAHNHYRTLHCAPPLELDDTISLSAQNYAEYLASTNTFQHSGTPDLGENLAWAQNSAGIVPNGRLFSQI